MPLRSKPEPGAQDQQRIEIQLRVERAFYVLGLPETVLLALEQKIADRNAGPLRQGSGCRPLLGAEPFSGTARPPDACKWRLKRVDSGREAKDRVK